MHGSGAVFRFHYNEHKYIKKLLQTFDNVVSCCQMFALIELGYTVELLYHHDFLSPVQMFILLTIKFCITFLNNFVIGLYVQLKFSNY